MQSRLSAAIFLWNKPYTGNGGKNAAVPVENIS